MISKRYLELLDEMADLHEKKSAGYSGQANQDAWSNFRGSEKFGVEDWKGSLIRLSDKYARICSLVKDPSNEKVGEKLEDTLMDLASYALITICLMEEHGIIKRG